MLFRSGLAIVPVMIAATSFLLIAYLAGNVRFADYLQINYVPGTGELTILLGALIGAGLGFLWYNAHPAAVFMGDTGALPLGAALATVALMTGHWLLLPIIGVVFVAEAASDVIQIAYFQTTGGRRLFRMTPLHHH